MMAAKSDLDLSAAGWSLLEALLVSELKEVLVNLRDFI